ncbi:putative Heterokaryon incompatibility domain-containing protein [Seiridium cardinale]|uniref:Heterokaryon incompatibility domain-containing protein n=1 Tax=Seiridium cardinale TaxID=138064 RepID=A0ABR2X8C2_9PEZI
MDELELSSVTGSVMNESDLNNPRTLLQRLKKDYFNLFQVDSPVWEDDVNGWFRGGSYPTILVCGRNWATKGSNPAYIPVSEWDDQMKEIANMVLKAMGFSQFAQVINRTMTPIDPPVYKFSRDTIPLTATAIRSSVKRIPWKETLPQTELPISPYLTLNSRKREIRLFSLRTRNNCSVISGSFVRVNLESCPEYTALSYTWGDEAASENIVLSDGGQIEIGKTLWSFLDQQSSLIKQEKLFWIDAICINQSDTHERNHQVGLMKLIYASAAKVFVWLGREDGDSNLAMTYTTNQSKKPLRQRGPGFYPLWSATEANSLDALFHRPYWTRMWVIQELLHAEQIQVWCGSKKFMWEDLEKLYLKIKIVEDANWSAHHYLCIPIMQSPAAVMVWQRAHWRHPETPTPTLRILIEIFRDWGCRDIRDKVFALVGMATTDSKIEPDYALSTKELYFAVMRRVEGTEFGFLLAQILGLSRKDLDTDTGMM